MGFLQVLTLIFITLKLMGYIDWSWWAVVSPTIFQIVLYVSFVTLALWSKGFFNVLKRKR